MTWHTRHSPELCQGLTVCITAVNLNNQVHPFWASLVALKVKNPPAMREARVWSLSWEDPLEEGMASLSSVLAWRIPMDRGAWQTTVHGVTKNQTWLSDWTCMLNVICFIFILFLVLKYAIWWLLSGLGKFWAQTALNIARSYCFFISDIPITCVLDFVLHISYIYYVLFCIFCSPPPSYLCFSLGGFFFFLLKLSSGVH